MRVAITGDRNWDGHRYKVVERALATLSSDTVVILGDARGVDFLARCACERLGLRFRVHRADWDKHHRAAGPIRNGAMLDDLQSGGDWAIAREVWYFHDELSTSQGTRNCVEQARKRGLIVRNGRAVALGGLDTAIS